MTSSSPEKLSNSASDERASQSDDNFGQSDFVQSDIEAKKPEILVAWKTKLFVLLLCVLSFYAGWQASRSYLVKQCYQAGGQVDILENSLITCQL